MYQSRFHSDSHRVPRRGFLRDVTAGAMAGWAGLNALTERSTASDKDAGPTVQTVLGRVAAGAGVFTKPREAIA